MDIGTTLKSKGASTQGVPRVRRLPQAMVVDEAEVPSARLHIAVRFWCDPSTGQWAFIVRNPAILGGGFHSRSEAEQCAADAVARCLSQGPPPGGDGDLGYLTGRLRLVC